MYDSDLVFEIILVLPKRIKRNINYKYVRKLRCNVRTTKNILNSIKENSHIFNKISVTHFLFSWYGTGTVTVLELLSKMVTYRQLK